MLAAGDGRLDWHSLRGLEPLSSREVTGIARGTAELIVRAHQPQLR